MFKSVRNDLMRGASVIAILTTIGTAYAQEPNAQPPAPPATTPQTPAPTTTPPATTPPAGTTPGTQIPQINVNAPKTTPKPTAARKPATTATRTATTAPAQIAAQTAEQREIQSNQRVVQQTSNLDTRRDEALQPKVGATISTMTQQDLENVPQGANISVSDLSISLWA
jgi:hypothetical protein